MITAPTVVVAAALGSHPEAAGKVVHVPPAVDLERFAPAAVSPPRTDAPLRVLYAGTLGLAQGLPTLVQAAALAGPEVVQLTIAGDGPAAADLAAEAHARKLTNVSMLGPVEPSRVPALYEHSDAGVVPLRDRPIFSGAVPTKLLEVLAAGRPAIVSARGESAELVLEAQAGMVVAPEDPHALAAAFARLRSDPDTAAAMGRRGLAKALEFDRARAVGQWWELLRSERLQPSRRG